MICAVVVGKITTYHVSYTPATTFYPFLLRPKGCEHMLDIGHCDPHGYLGCGWSLTSTLPLPCPHPS